MGESIYETLLARLISLDIPPGERLAVDALVRQLGVSQTQIRSALIRLEMDGLVTRRHNAGYSAAPMPSGEPFGEIYDFRLLLEPAAAAQAALRMTRKLAAALTVLEDQLAALVSSNECAAYGKFAVLDARFHRLVAERCGNSLVSDALGRLYAHMHLFRLRHHTTVTAQAIEEHRTLVAAMFARDPEASSQAMRDHIIASRKRMAPYYERLPPE